MFLYTGAAMGLDDEGVLVAEALHDICCWLMN
jgi:hypothetical protein